MECIILQPDSLLRRYVSEGGSSRFMSMFVLYSFPVLELYMAVDVMDLIVTIYP